MENELAQQIRKNLAAMETGQLRKIWEDNDKDQYSEEAFRAVKEILQERGERLPDQHDSKARSSGKDTGDFDLKPKLARGFLWWGLFLIIMRLYRLFSSNLPALSIAMSFLGLTLSILLCVMWFQFTKIRLRRRKVPYALGTGAFFIGTLIPPIIGQETGMVLSSQTSFSLSYTVGNTYPMVLFPAVLCTIAYFLHFRAKSSAQC
jgi:hypothetical protein